MLKIKKIWNRWKKISKRIINFQSKILLTLIYFIFIPPTAIIMKFLSDPLKLKKYPQWFVRKKEKSTIDTLKEQ